MVALGDEIEDIVKFAGAVGVVSDAVVNDVKAGFGRRGDQHNIAGIHRGHGVCLAVMGES